MRDYVNNQHNNKGETRTMTCQRALKKSKMLVAKGKRCKGQDIAGYANKPIAPLKAIRRKCLNCGTTSDGVRHCEFIDCPLYVLRFGKSVPRGTSRLKAIREKCLDCMNGMKKEIGFCTNGGCYLYPFRRGRNPYRS